MILVQVTFLYFFGTKPGSYSGHGEDLICIALLLDYPAITISRLSQFDLKDISRSVPFLGPDGPMFDS